MSPPASPSLDALLPFSRPPSTPASPLAPLRLATGCAHLHRRLSPHTPLFLDAPLASLLASQHHDAIHWTLLPSAAADLHALSALPRAHDAIVVILPDVSPRDEAVARQIALTRLRGCGLVVVRETGGCAARAAAQSGREGAQWGEALFGAGDVVVPPGADSRGKIDALVDAEGLGTAVLAGEKGVEVGERGCTGEGNEEEEDGRGQAREEERRWRMEVRRVGKEAAEMRGREERGEGGEGLRVEGKGEESVGKKSDFFLQLLAKSL